MVEFPSNYPIQGPQGSGPLGSSYTNQDTETTFNQLTDAVWQAFDAFKNSSDNALNAQTFMQAVTALNTFLLANPPAQGTPAATVLADLTATSSGSSILTECETYTNEAVAWLQGNVSSELMTNLWDFIDSSSNITNVTNDKGNTTIQTDINNLQGDLNLYNWYEQDEYQNPATLSSLLTNIAKDINQLDTDAKNQSPALSDGFLTSLITYLNTPLAAGGTDTLQSLSSAVLANNPPAQSDLDNLNNALGELGEQSSNSGGSFNYMIQDTINYEYLDKID